MSIPSKKSIRCAASRENLYDATSLTMMRTEKPILPGTIIVVVDLQFAETGYSSKKEKKYKV
jgi:hypothetical protein